MTQKTKLYLVGHRGSEKSNDYLAMCKTIDEAQRLLQEMKEATHIKEVRV